MQVQAVHGAAPHDIYPAVGHGERASGEIQLQPARERRDVTIELACQRGERPVTAGACGAPSCKKCSRRDNCAPTSASPAASSARSWRHSRSRRAFQPPPAPQAQPRLVQPVSETGPACSCDARQYASAALKCL